MTMDKVLYYIIYPIFYLVSLLPLRVLYVFSDIQFFIVYSIVGYRKKVVRKNLRNSFPDKSEKELLKIEKEFYHWLCDYFNETVKLLSVSKKTLLKHIEFRNVEQMEQCFSEGQNCAAILGHYCNWEWIASLPYWCPDDVKCGQIYHPLYNKAFDRLFLRLRNQFGGECIAMKETLRRIIEMKRAKQKCIIGFISDQAPKWNSIHHWCDFLHRETPVFIGTERIGKQVDALIYYADVKHTRRGYYLCEFKPLTHRPKEVPDYELTDRFTRLLEVMIKDAPHIWLWTHKRWKRTKEEWEQRMKNGE